MSETEPRCWDDNEPDCACGGHGPVRTLGQRIASKRGRRPQRWLAEQCGVTQTAVSYWESDKRTPELDMIPRLAVALRCDPGWLAFGQPTLPFPAQPVTRTAPEEQRDA